MNDDESTDRLHPIYSNGEMCLGIHWYEGFDDEALDEGMPQDARNRIADVLETRGDEVMVRGISGCRYCRTDHGETERTIPSDALANTPLRRWAHALGHMVRAHGLRIDEQTLADWFGIDRNGNPIAIRYTSHA